MAKNSSTDEPEALKVSTEKGEIPEPAFTPPEDVANADTAPEKPEVGKVKGKLTHHTNKLKSFVRAYWAKKKWTLPVTVGALLVLIAAVPFTRYETLGLFLKKPVVVTVLDSKTNTPVSGATVELGGKTFKTDGSGKASGQVKLGSTSLNVTKQYYKSTSSSVLVELSKEHNTFKLMLVAVGRQVPIKIVDKISGKPLVNAEIKVLNTSAKTDKKGIATIVLPTALAAQKASVQLAGYNTLASSIQVTDQVVAANTFQLVPAGKLYFLSNLTGKIDVVKTDLDGSNRQTVVAGTGSEDANKTSLLASKDWKYLALLSRRAGTSASLYLIDTSTDKLTTMDEGDATFTLVGWSGDKFAYYVNRNLQAWQPKQTAIKMFDAPTQKLTTLYETGAEGDTNNYNTESLYWIQQAGSKLVWYTNWNAHNQYYTNFGGLNGKQAQVFEYDIDKATRKTLKSYTVSGEESRYGTYESPYTSWQSIVYAPGEIYFAVSMPDDSTNYVEYDEGTLTENSKEAKAYFESNGQAYATYLESPSDKATFWTEQRDGKNALFTGDSDAKNEKQIATLSDYSPYGWYTDNYLLVSKNSSELYILAADGSGTPQKITDYYKPPISYGGYGGGYGGL